ncbi:MAG: DUF4352 domain-containing protein [Candidatus Micrarchaeota archaeon]|nr:DUF4352 domain-containing protein [Candidatus Micrarchaeota archaeon]
MAGKNVQVTEAGGAGMGSIAPGSGHDYEMGGAPKKEKISKTNIGSAVGKDVFVVRAGKKLPVAAEIGGKPFRLEDGDRVETGEGSYVLGLTDIPTGDNPNTSIMLYPNSAVEISTRHSAAGSVEGGADVITKVGFIKGMIMFGGPCEFEFKQPIPVKVSPTAMGMAVSFCAEIRQDGSVAFFRRMAEIEHTRAKVKAGLFAKETIATSDAIYDLPALEPRYEEALKVIDLWAKAQGAPMGRKALEHPTPGVEDFKKEMEGAISANVANMRRELAENEYLPREVAADYKKQIADFERGSGLSKAFTPKDEERGKEAERKASVQRAISNGEAALSKLASLQLPAPQKLDPKYLITADKSERRAMSMDDYVRNAWAKSAKINELDQQLREGKISKTEFAAKSKSLQDEIVAPLKKSAERIAKAGKEGEPMLDAVSAKVKIGKTVQYGSISIEVRGAEMGPEFKMMKSQPGTLFVAVSMKLENTKSASTAYIVPDEELWLNFGASEPVKPENYKFETALDKGKPTEGYVWYTVPADSKKFSLMFGKKKMPKTPLDFGF